MDDLPTPGSGHPDNTSTERIPAAEAAAGAAFPELSPASPTGQPSGTRPWAWRASPNRQWMIAGAAVAAVLLLGSTFTGGFVVASVMDGLRNPAAAMSHHVPWMDREGPAKRWLPGGKHPLHSRQPVAPSTPPGGFGTP